MEWDILKRAAYGWAPMKLFFSTQIELAHFPSSVAECFRLGIVLSECEREEGRE